RLTREHVRAGLMLLLGLIEKGIRIVQLSPSELVYDQKSDEMGLMLAIVELSRGHRESKRKSDMLGKAWREKKRQAASGKKMLTRAAPSWLRVEGERFVIVESAAAVVRRIYSQAIAGHGIGAITHALNDEAVPAIGRATYWVKSYVAKLLSN